jgi:signal transduction histidine kinase
MNFSNYKYIILLVDPLDEYRKMINNYFLTTTSCNVITCSTDTEALSILKKTPVNMIIYNADHEEAGIAFYKHLQAHSKDLVKVLLISSVQDTKELNRQFSNGLFNKYLTKPFEDIHLFLMAFEAVNEHLTRTLDERIRMEEQFIHNEKMSTLGQMMAGISHELKNPTTFIHSNLNNLKKFIAKVMGMFDQYDRMNLPDEMLSEINACKKEINFDYLKQRIPIMIERTAEGAERLKKILLDLKLFYRKDAQSFEMADINAAIESSINIIIHEYKDRITLEKDFGYLPDVECNITKLNQVFVNLLINACHAIEGDGQITVSTRSQEDQVEISIEDTGCGMPESVQKQIFQPFYTTKPGSLGSGLGLSISAKIIKAHGGTISVESTEGKGTTFTIVIPVSQGVNQA